MLILDNENIEQIFNCVVTDIRGRGPVNQEAILSDIANEDGSLLRRVERPAKPLEIDIVFSGDSQEDLRDEVDRLNGFIYSRETREIKFADEMDKTYYGVVTESTDNEEVVNTKQMTIVFLCPKPRKHGALRRAKNSKEVFVSSNDEAIPEIFVYVNESTDSITLSLDNEELKIIYDFNADDVLYIDCHLNKVFINDVLQMGAIDLEKADFFRLKKGKNNIEINPDFPIDIIYQEYWLM